MAVRSNAALVLLVVLVMVGSSCGGSGDNASPQESGQAASNGDDAAGDDAGGGGGSVGGDGLPDSVRADFPADVPGGWEIDLQGEIGMTNTTSVQLLYPADASDSLIAFYDEWTESQGEEYARTEAGAQVIYTGTGSVYSITITPGHQERDQTWTLLQVITPGE